MSTHGLQSCPVRCIRCILKKEGSATRWLSHAEKANNSLQHLGGTILVSSLETGLVAAAAAAAGQAWKKGPGRMSGHSGPDLPICLQALHG